MTANTLCAHRGRAYDLAMALHRIRIVPVIILAALALLVAGFVTPPGAAAFPGAAAIPGGSSGSLTGAARTPGDGIPGIGGGDRGPGGDGAVPGRPLSGRVIYLDPGHAGALPDPMPQVTDGRGGTKPCQVSGTAANDGWPEHTFNWLMAGEIRSRLEALGATVLLSRDDDESIADCIDERARKENASDADLVVSLHADGSSEGNRGFHVIAVADPLPGNDADGSLALARSLRDSLVAAGFAPSNYLGKDGIDLRSDLTGLNLSEKPKALIEFGNMRDSSDIALMHSDDGRARMADAVVAGISRAAAQQG